MSQQRATDLTCNETLPLDEEPRLSGQQPTVRRFQVASTPSQGPFRVNYPPGQAPPQQKTYTASQIARPVASRSYTVANPAPPRNVIGGSTGIHNISSTSNTSTPIHRGFVAPNNVTRVIRPAPQQSDHDHGPVTFTTHATHQVPIVRHPLDNRFDIHGTRHSHTPQPVHQANLPSPFVNSLRLTQAPPAPPAGSKTAQGLLNVVQSMNRHSTSPSLGQFNQSIFGAQHFSQTNYGTGASTSRIVGASPIIPHPRFSAQNNGSGNKVVHSTPGVVRFQTTTPAAPMSHIQTPAIHRVQTTTPHIIHGNSGSQFVHPAAGLMGIAQTTVNTPSPRPSILRKPSTPGSAAKRKLGFGTELPGTSAGTISGASASPSVRSIIQNTNDATNSVAKALGSVAAPVTNGTEGESPRKRPRKQQFDSSQHEPMMMAVGMEAIKTPIWELPRDHPMAQEYFRNMQMIPPEKKKRGRPRADATRSNATADQFMVQTGVRRVFVPMDQLPNQAISHIAQQQNQMLNPGMSNPAAAAIAAALEAVGLQNTFNTQASTSRTVVGNTLHNLNPNQTVKEALSQMAADKAKVDLERKTAEQAEAKARADAIARAHSAAQIEQVRAAVTASHATKGAPAKGRPTAEKKKAAAAANDPKVTTSKKESREVATKRAPAKKKTAPKKGAAKAKKPVEKEVKDEVEEEVKGKLKSPKKKKIIKKKKVVKGAAVKKVVAKKAPPKEMTIAEQENNALCYLTTLMRGNLRQKALLTKSETVTKMGLLKRYFPNKYRQVDEPVPSIRTNRPKLFFERYNSRWNHFNKIENLEKAYDDKKTARKIQKLNDNIRNRLRKQCKITAKNAVKQLEPKLLHFCKLNRLRAPELKSRKRFVKILTKVYMDRIEAFVKENYPHIRRKNEKQKEAEAEAAEKKQEEKEKQTDFAMKCIRLLKKRVRTGKVEKKFIGEGESRTLVQTFSKSMGRCRYEFTASETRKKNPKSKKVVKTKKALKVADKQDKKKLRERLAKLRAKASAKVKPAETAASNVEVKKEKDEQGIEANSSQSSVAALLTRPSKKAKNGTSTKLGNAASLPVAKPSNTSAMNSLVSALNAARFPSSSPAPGPSTFAPAGPTTASDLPGPSTSKTLSSASDDFCPKVLVSIAKASSKKPIHRRIIKVASEDEVVARLLADARCRSLSPAVKYVVATPEELKKDAEDKKRRLRKVDDNTRKSVLSKLQETADNGTLIGLQDSLKETAERESTSTTAEVKPEVKDEPPSDEPEVKQILKPTQPVTKPVASNEKPVKETLIKANKSILIPAASQPAPVLAIAKVPTAASGSVPKPKPAHKWKDIRPQEVAQPVVKNIRESVKESISKYNSTLAKASATSEKKNSTESVAVPTLPKKAKTALQPWQILRSKKILKEMGMWRSKKVADKKDASPAKLSKPKKARAMRRLSLRTMTAKRLAMNYLRELRKEKLQVSALPKKTEKQKLVRKKKKERHNNKVTKFFAFLEKSRILRVASKKKKSRKLKRMTPLQKKKFAAALHKAKQTGKAPLKVKKALKRKLKTVVAANKTVPGTAATKTLKKNVKERKKDSVPKKDKMKKIKKAKATGKQKVSKAVVKKNKKAKKSRALKKARYPLTRADRCAIEEVVDSLASAVSFELDKDQKERDAFENRSALRNLKGCPIMSNGMSELNRVLRAQKARQRMENYSLRQVFPASPPRSVHRPEDFDFRSNNVSIPTDYEKSKDWWAAVTGSKKVRSRNCKTRAEKRHEKMIRLLKKLKAEMKQNAKKPTEKPAAEDGKDERIYIAPAETSEKKITFVAFQKLLRKMHPSRRVAILRKVKKRMFDVKRNLRLKQAEDKMERRKARRLKKKKEKKAKRKLKKLKKIKKAKKKAEKLAAAEATKSDAAVKKEKESAEAGSSQQLACEEGLSVPPVAMEVEVETTVDSPKKRQKGRATKSKKQSVKKTTSVVAPVVDYRQFLRPIDRELTFADIFAEADKEDEAEAPKFKALKLSAIKVAEKSSAKPMASKASKDEKKEKEGKASKKVGKKKSKKAAKKESNKKKVVKRIRLNPARRHLIRLYGRGSRLRVTKRYRRKIRKAKKAVKLAKEMTSKRNIERCAMLKESKKYKLALEKAKWLRNGRGSKEAKKFLLEEWKLKLKSMKKVRKLKKKRREAEKKLKEKRKAQQKAAAEQLVKKQGMKPSVAKRHVKRTIRLPYSHPTAQDIAVRRFRDYQDTLLEQLDTDRKVLLMFEQYLKTWDPASYNKLQKDIIRDYEPGDSPDTISRKKLARIRVTLLRPQIELPPPKRPPHIEACDVVIINPSKATMNSTITSSSPFWEAPTCSKNDNNRRILRNGHMTSDRPDDWKPLDMTPRIIYPDEMAQWCTEDQRDMVLGNLDEVYEKYLASLGPDAPIDVPDDDSADFEEKPVVQGVSRRTLIFKHKGNEEVTFLGEVTKPKLELVDETDSPMNDPKTKAHWSMNRELLATSYKDIYDTSCLMVQTMLHMKASLCPEEKPAEVAPPATPEPVVVVEKKKPAPAPRAKKQPKTGKKAQKQQKAAAQAKKDAKKEPAKPRATPKHPRAPRTPVITESTFERQIRRAIQESLKSMPSTSQG